MENVLILQISAGKAQHIYQASDLHSRTYFGLEMIISHV